MTSSTQRIPVRIAIKALRNGADPQQVAEFLQAVVDVEEETEQSARDAFYAALEQPPVILSSSDDEVEAAMARHPAGKQK